MKQPRKIITSLLVVAGLILNGFGGVLCLNDNGETKVESLCQPCDNNPAELCDLIPDGDPDDQHPECHDCLDVQLNQPARANRHLVKSTFGIDTRYRANFAVIINTGNDTNRPLHSPVRYTGIPPAIPPTDISISTVILLC